MRDSSGGTEAPLRSCLVPIYILVFLSARYIFLSLDLESLSSRVPRLKSASHSNEDQIQELQQQLSSALETIEELQQQTAPDFAKISPVCRPRFLSNGNKINRIFFLHMRKAGGTTIRRYLNKVAKEYNLTFDAAEGKETRQIPMDANTLYVTNLREPVERVISNYRYDQRWDCKKLLNTKKYKFEPSYNNTLGLSLDDFVQKGSLSNKKFLLWNCGSNCYMRWVTGYYFDGGDACLIQEDDERVQVAREALLKYHLIINTERLGDENYTRGIEAMFGVVGLTGSKPTMYCGPESAAANELFPLVIANSTRKIMNDCNVGDALLYKELTKCQDGIEFPAFNRSFFI